MSIFLADASRGYRTNRPFLNKPQAIFTRSIISELLGASCHKIVLQEPSSSLTTIPR